MKVLRKADIFRKKTRAIVQGEVDVLARAQHPFIIHLFGVFQVREATEEYGKADAKDPIDCRDSTILSRDTLIGLDTGKTQPPRRAARQG